MPNFDRITVDNIMTALILLDHKGIKRAVK